MTIKTYLDHLPENKQHHITTIRDTILDGVEEAVKSSISKKKHYKIVLILFGSYTKRTFVVWIQAVIAKFADENICSELSPSLDEGIVNPRV
jgi:hypothetical protein